MRYLGVDVEIFLGRGSGSSLMVLEPGGNGPKAFSAPGQAQKLSGFRYQLTARNTQKIVNT